MTEERIKVVVEVDLPKELYRDFIQHIRDFDMKHGNGTRVHFEMAAELPTMTQEEILGILRSIDPPCKYEQVIPREEIGDA